MNAVVTGASGFIGGALTRRLIAEGWAVTTLGRRPVEGTRFVAWELGALVPSLEKVDVVFHVAARVGDWGRREDFERENVDSTKRLLEACEIARVPAFVFTGSPSAFLGDYDVEGADERVVEPAEHLSEYGRSKALADRLVRAHRGVTRTTVLRPHAVIGPGERHLHRLVRAMALLGSVVQLGDDVHISVTSLETCVTAHLRAARRLLEGQGGGDAFFVADAPAVSLHALLAAEVERRTGRPPSTLRLPPEPVRALARFAEWFHAPFPKWAPIINRYRVAMLSRSHWFDVTRMHDVLGVTPRDARQLLDARTSAMSRPSSSQTSSLSSA